MTESTEQKQQATEQAPAPSLLEQYRELMIGMSELEKIPAYRPDLKAQEAQTLTQQAINLTGQLVVTVQSQTQDIYHLKQMAEKLGAWLDGQEGWNHEES